MSNLSQELDAIEAGLAALHRVNFQHRAWEDVRQRAGLTVDRASAVLLKAVAMHDNSPCRMYDIAHYLGIEAPSVTRTVRELETAGLVHRQADKADRRASNISITAAGREQLKRLQSVRRARLSKATRSWPAEDRLHLARLLHRLAADFAAAQTKHNI